MAKFDELLPIGSVVRVKGAQRNLMICGRVVTRTGSDDIYDYVACLYPEGLIDASDLYFFNKVNKIAALTLSSKKRLLI